MNGRLLNSDGNSKAALSLPERIIKAIRATCGEGVLGLHEPTFSGNEWCYLKNCLDSTYVSSVGKYVDEFESSIAEYTGASHAIAVVNGTSALHISLLLAGVCAGDEVIVPALTFVASANAIKYCGAHPHFVDCNENTLGIDPLALRDWLSYVAESIGGVTTNRFTGRPIRVLMPMHAFGHPAELVGLQSVADDYRLVLVEDAAESLGSFLDGRHTGTIGRLGALSFNGNKTITTGGGGAILTNDSHLASRAKHITSTAKIPHRWAFIHDEVGFNYRMPNINAALGCAQLEQLPKFLAAKRRLYEKYSQEFSGMSSELHLVSEPDGCSSNYWLQTLILNKSASGRRDQILAETNENGIMTRPAWDLINTLEPYSRDFCAPLTVAKSLAERIINIPSGSYLA